MSDLITWLQNVRAFEAEAAELLGKSDEAIRSRAYNATDALQRVSKLSFEQSDSLRQAIRCVEHGLHRAAFVMAWTAAADLLLHLSVEKVTEVKTKRPNWKYTDKSSLSDELTDFAIIEALKDAKILTKSQMKTLHGLLHRRNQCAHRSDLFPSANEALGFVDETLSACSFLIKELSK